MATAFTVPSMIFPSLYKRVIAVFLYAFYRQFASKYTY